MQSIIIAAGYATRLYPLTEHFPKPLLQIGQSTILDRLLDDLDTIPDISRHLVVTNHKFIRQFQSWAAPRNNVTLIDDGTTTNEGRLGAVRDLLLAVDHMGEADDLLVAAADNLLDFSLSGFVQCFRQKGTSLIMCHHEPSVEKLRRTGVITVDDNMRVLSMQEKPQEPASHWAVPPLLYIRARGPAPHPHVPRQRLRIRRTRQPRPFPRRAHHAACLAYARETVRHRVARHLPPSAATLCVAPLG